LLFFEQSNGATSGTLQTVAVLLRRRAQQPRAQRTPSDDDDETKFPPTPDLSLEIVQYQLCHTNRPTAVLHLLSSCFASQLTLGKALASVAAIGKRVW
jgi:hypothetical protein